MAAKKTAATKKTGATKKATSASASGEWIGGLVRGPGMVTGEGPPFEPESLFWMSTDGAILGSATGRPSDVVRDAARSLTETMKKPLVGRPSVPARVRVASPALADALRAAHPTIDVVVAPTPEIDEMGAIMRSELSELMATMSMSEPAAPLTESYLTGGITPDAMAALFRAAAVFYRAAPWDVVPDDQCLLFATSEALGLNDAPVSIVGQGGQTFGFIVFADIDTFEHFIGLADSPHRLPGEIPPHLSLNFERKRDMPPRMVREITTHRWEVAGPKATPLLGVVTREGPVDLGPRDVATLEVLATALADAAQSPDLASAWFATTAWTRDFVVHAQGGAVPLRLSTTESDGTWERVDTDLDPDGLLAPLHDLARGSEEIDPDARQKIEQALYQDFLRSPEAANARIDEVQWCKCVTDMAATYLGETLATLSGDGLRQVVFELIPRKVMVDADAAGEIVSELRALYGYLGRAQRLPQAGDGLRVLGPDAEARLAAALSDPSQFSMGKALLAQGAAAGYDMQSQEGIERWMAATSGARPPAARKVGAAAAAKTKNQRKAARQARKKNR